LTEKMQEDQTPKTPQLQVEQTTPLSQISDKNNLPSERSLKTVKPQAPCNRSRGIEQQAQTVSKHTITSKSDSTLKREEKTPEIPPKTNGIPPPAPPLEQTLMSKDKQCRLPGYQQYSVPKGPNSHGSIILVMATIPSSEVEPVHCGDGVEAQAVRIQLANDSLVVYNIYKPPPKRLEAGELLTQATQELVLIAGDFNAHHPTINSTTRMSQVGHHLVELLTDVPEITLINTGEPTHILGGTLDLTFISTELVPIDDELTSDHFATTTTLRVELLPPPPRPPPRWNSKKANWKLYQDQLQKWYSNYEPAEDIDQLNQDLTDAIQHAAEKAIPKTNPTNRHHRDYWFYDEEVREQNHRINTFRRHLRQYPSPEGVKLLRAAVQHARQITQKIWEDKWLEWIATGKLPRAPAHPQPLQEANRLAEQFTEHSDRIGKRVNMMRAMTGPKVGAGHVFLRTLYIHAIRSLTDYATPALNTLSEWQWAKLEVAQNSALRAITGLTSLQTRAERLTACFATKLITRARESDIKKGLLRALNLNRNVFNKKTWLLCETDAVNRLKLKDTILNKGPDTMSPDYSTPAPWESPPAVFNILQTGTRKADSNPHALRQVAERNMKVLTPHNSTVYYTDGSVEPTSTKARAAFTIGGNTSLWRTSYGCSTLQVDLATIHGVLRHASINSQQGVVIHTGSRLRLDAIEARIDGLGSRHTTTENNSRLSCRNSTGRRTSVTTLTEKLDALTSRLEGTIGLLAPSRSSPQSDVRATSLPHLALLSRWDTSGATHSRGSTLDHIISGLVASHVRSSSIPTLFSDHVAIGLPTGPPPMQSRNRIAIPPKYCLTYNSYMSNLLPTFDLKSPKKLFSSLSLHLSATHQTSLRSLRLDPRLKYPPGGKEGCGVWYLILRLTWKPCGTSSTKWSRKSPLVLFTTAQQSTHKILSKHVRYLPEHIQESFSTQSNLRALRLMAALLKVDGEDTVEITKEELQRALIQGRATAPGDDGVTYLVLRLLQKVPGNPFLLLCNLCLRTGYVPNACTSSTIEPIPKCGTAKFRPISLTYCFSKVMERILLTRLWSHVSAGGQTLIQLALDINVPIAEVDHGPPPWRIPCPAVTFTHTTKAGPPLIQKQLALGTIHRVSISVPAVHHLYSTPSIHRRFPTGMQTGVRVDLLLQKRLNGIIVCDSQSALQALYSSKPLCLPLIQRLLRQLALVHDNSRLIHFLWVPSHFGITNNDT
ncbi:putative RNA-directed DNA polymerase from mobile element jockey-like 53, partial [Homarus americanus]